MTDLIALGKNAKAASRKLAVASGETKAKALKAMAYAVRENREKILAANSIDMQNGERAGMNQGLLDRLRLTEARIAGMAESVLQIADAPDPVGRVVWGENRPNGLAVQKVSVPLGVIAVIFEARPNVTTDAAALCIKAGNAVILKGGKEAVHSNGAIAAIMRNALEENGLPADSVIFIEDNAREVTGQLMRLNDYVDVLIPRGGAGLIRATVENSTVPVIQTGVGNCHIYVDKDADIQMAANIIENAKTSRVSVCNACESLLIHKDIAAAALPLIGERLQKKNVEIRGDETACRLLPYAVPATREDWGTEYLDYIISVKTVDGLEEATAHIAQYGTGHSECIVTENLNAARTFTASVDAAAVYVNASTRFTDGGEFGFGAEIGISTQKLHARGPLGLANLVSEKYVINGNGQVR